MKIFVLWVAFLQDCHYMRSSRGPYEQCQRCFMRGHNEEVRVEWTTSKYELLCWSQKHPQFADSSFALYWCATYAATYTPWYCYPFHLLRLVLVNHVLLGNVFLSSLCAVLYWYLASISSYHSKCCCESILYFVKPVYHPLSLGLSLIGSCT